MKRKFNHILFSILLFSLQACSIPSCGSIGLPASLAEEPPGHESWTLLLQKHVDEKGMVDYKGFMQDREQLTNYLRLLEENPPGEKWSEAEKLAYWINAYNAYTIDLVLEHYPLKSIKDIGTVIQIPFVNSPWDIEFIEIGGKEYDLNNIEHNIIREEFEEPRIHFALVCAAVSCPKLRREAYTAEKLHAQLREQTKTFLANPERNQIGAKKVKLSKLFDWYKGDFTKEGSLIDFLNQYTPVQIEEDAKIDYLEYDWSLNEQH
ncbi:DUF547 domain-containing protein [Nafulsella turpanensis]|uniref:DUF547 domain-containing protein n=1 Tax=Nafulsella turpanensis TaxID=1265690 RepID=UPI0003450E78|nr:DUF547 domain-containing protein [Nafulsella turpanensis]